MRTILLSVGSDFVKEVDSKFMIKIAPLWFSRWLGNLLICFVSLGVLFLILEAALILFVPEPITWLLFRVPVAFWGVRLIFER